MNKLLLLGALAAPLAADAARIIDREVTVQAAEASVPAVPARLSAPAAANLKLWIYDPRPKGGSFHPTGIFIEKVGSNGGWKFVEANPDRSVYAHLVPGSYQFDVVEPDEQFTRRRYQLSVAQDGAVSLNGTTADARGFFPITLGLAGAPAAPEVKAMQEKLAALANEPASSFKPASACQLMDQVTPQRSFATDLSAGFPKVRVRLPSFGSIRALIVPVDFPEVRGKADPGAVFTSLADDVRDFYVKQSYGRLHFEFDILSHWVHLPFSPAKYGFTAVNGSGDVDTYRNDIIAMTDGQIDYSRYDAVYFLVPPETPKSAMGYGPAITSPTYTRTGYVVNGATGGADMYAKEASVAGARWKWMAHETGHTFGLYDEDLHHASATLGNWGVMAYNWSNTAIEHNAWDRYLQGWLDEAQVACLPRERLAGQGQTIKLDPLVRQDQQTKAAMVPLSASKVLVLESRRNEGYDHLAPANEGLLAYTVDMTLGTLGGGYRTQRRPGSTDPRFEDAALHVGDRIKVDGVQVEVIAAGKDGDTVKLSTP